MNNYFHPSGVDNVLHVFKGQCYLLCFSGSLGTPLWGTGSITIAMLSDLFLGRGGVPKPRTPTAYKR